MSFTILVKAVEFVVRLSEVTGPGIDVDTSRLISACSDCQSYHSEVVGRMEALEQRLKGDGSNAQQKSTSITVDQEEMSVD